MHTKNRHSRHHRKYLCGVFLAILTIIFGCSKKGQERAEYEITVNVDSLVREEISIYDIFTKVELVALDNEFPVANIVYTGASNITWDGKRFYILDVAKFGINVYRTDGSLVSHFDKVGRGPGE